MDFFERIYFQTTGTPLQGDIHSCPQLIELIHEVGFLPLLDSGIAGYSAEGLLAEECRYDMETANKAHTEYFEQNPYMVGKVTFYPEVKQEDIDTLTSLVEKADTIISDDEAVFNIIAEEAAGYFAGDRTIDDVLKNIQNRTKIIVQEY